MTSECMVLSGSSLDPAARTGAGRRPGKTSAVASVARARYDGPRRSHRMNPVTTDRILVHVADGIGWLTLNNPERRNAISLDMWRGIGAALEAFQHDAAVRVAV